MDRDRRAVNYGITEVTMAVACRLEKRGVGFASLPKTRLP